MTRPSYIEDVPEWAQTYRSKTAAPNPYGSTMFDGDGLGTSGCFYGTSNWEGSGSGDPLNGSNSGVPYLLAFPPHEGVRQLIVLWKMLSR